VTSIRHAVVLGAGVMGAQIAAHLANAGVRTRLLDLTPAAARDGLDRAVRLSPDPFFTKDAQSLVSTAGFDDGLDDLASADWIIEAVVEDLDAKRRLLARVEPSVAPHAVVSSNTSGIPLSAIAEGFGEPLRRRWLGTHFFNPPRYLKLLELIPTEWTDPAVVERIAAFGDVRLGKGVVIARDAPGFIANRLAVFGVARTLEIVAQGQFTIAEVDALSGPLIGRPRSATFRTMDIAGIDVLLRVADDLSARLGRAGQSTAFTLPAFVHDLVARGWTGVKAGQGFYRKRPDGQIESLDQSAMEYRLPAGDRVEGIDAALSIEDVGERLRRVFFGADRAGRFLRATLGAQLIYAARVAPSISHSIDDVDRAMRWGFGWELGPFETWDAIGVERAIEACGVDDLPPLLAEARDSGAFRPARVEGPQTRTLQLVPPVDEGCGLIRVARDRPGGVVRRNAAASLVDLGDGVLAVDLHSKMNAIGGDTIEMLEAGVAEAEARGRALVVGTEGPNFSAGANLMLLLLESQEGNWDEVDLMVRSFQRMTMALRHAAVPVVAAPAGLALGGGCEICLHADHVEAAAETYMGLVEVSVGLIPAGGGIKELLARGMEAAPAGADPQPVAQRVFETIGFARVSTSAPDARLAGYLRPSDGVRMNRERLIAGARAAAIARVEGYVSPEPRRSVRVGGAGVRAALTLGVHLALRAGRISDHDATIGRQLARVIAGGDLAHEGTLSDQQLLDLEREAFLSLCGEPRTLERIAHTLRTGKPLRN
jgi:3-hydroxyacyl-CoA dehydrogenase